MSLQQCNHCGKTGHSRITSKVCALNAEYKNASPEGRSRLLKRCRANCDAKRAQAAKRKAVVGTARAKHDAKRSGTPERKAVVRTARAKHDAKRSGTPERKAVVRTAGAKRDAKRSGTPERKAVVRTARAKHNTTSKRKMSRKRWKKQNTRDNMSRDIAKESQMHGIYAANSRKFASCAAANIAKQVASHINMSDEDVKRILKPLQDSEILRIKQRWGLHIASGANSHTCSTCGESGLADLREYLLQNPCINAFKVICLIDMCSVFT